MLLIYLKVFIYFLFIGSRKKKINWMIQQSYSLLREFNIYNYNKDLMVEHIANVNQLSTLLH